MYNKPFLIKMKTSELKQLIKEEITKIVNENNDFPSRSLIGIFTDEINKYESLNNADQQSLLKCMYTAYKLGKSSGTWK